MTHMKILISSVGTNNAPYDIVCGREITIINTSLSVTTVDVCLIRLCPRT